MKPFPTHTDRPAMRAAAPARDLDRPWNVRPFGFGALACLLLACGLFTACATAPAPVMEESPAVSAARAAAERGDWEAAAVQWTRAAEADPASAAANAAWLRAADAWWRSGDAMRTRQALERVDSARLDRENGAREALLRGEMALALADREQAEFYLDAAAEDLPRSERARLGRARDALEALRSDPSALLLADVAELLERNDPVDAAMSVEVLQRLETVPGDRLAAEAEKPTRLGQWSALALDVRGTLVRREDLLEAATEWAILNPLHPVGEEAYLEIAWQYGQRFSPPSRIAVLLPTSGPFAAAGMAIRDGLVAAWLDRPARSELTFLPVGETPASALKAYRQAEASGFDWVIGPLNRASVQEISDRPAARLPALFLNWPEPPDAPSPFVTPEPTGSIREVDQFGLSLSQQAEAEAVARLMLREGHRRAILLLADGDWAERTEAAFVDAFLAGGGEIVALERFSPGQADHSERLTRLLQIEDGRERRRQLQGLLNLPLEYEDSRRDDFGAFFMAADPVLGRQLKPQLRFFDAGDKPVFAMGRVFSGAVVPGEDVDLDGVVIPATRWALGEDRKSRPEFASLRGGAFASLHALGRDAWNLLPWLDLMTRDRDFAYPGAIGDIVLRPDGRLEREPVWAVFRRGRPVPLEGGP